MGKHHLGGLSFLCLQMRNLALGFPCKQSVKMKKKREAKSGNVVIVSARDCLRTGLILNHQNPDCGTNSDTELGLNETHPKMDMLQHWLWLKKLWQVETWTKTCGLPLSHTQFRFRSAASGLAWGARRPARPRSRGRAAAWTPAAINGCSGLWLKWNPRICDTRAEPIQRGDSLVSYRSGWLNLV